MTPESWPGGHSLIPMMKLRLAQPELLVDINGLTELAYIKLDGAQLRIGALARHADLLDSAEAGRHFPIFGDAERVVADPIVRLWGTVGGSLCQADPSEDLSAAFAATRAIAVIRGAGGSRGSPGQGIPPRPVRDRGRPGRTAGRGPGAGPARHRQRLREGGAAGGGLVGGRRRGGPAARQNVIAQAGIGLTAVGAEHFVAAEAEDYLRGRVPDEESFTRAGAIAAKHCHPVADQRGPEDYKRHLVAELTTRALRRAAGRAAVTGAPSPPGGGKAA